MNDNEFLSYCRSMARTPRCGFPPVLIARLLQLAGKEAEAKTWDNEPARVVNCDPDAIIEHVDLAQNRMAHTDV